MGESKRNERLRQSIRTARGWRCESGGRRHRFLPPKTLTRMKPRMGSLIPKKSLVPSPFILLSTRARAGEAVRVAAPTMAAASIFGSSFFRTALASESLFGLETGGRGDARESSQQNVEGRSDPGVGVVGSPSFFSRRSSRARVLTCGDLDGPRSGGADGRRPGHASSLHHSLSLSLSLSQSVPSFLLGVKCARRTLSLDLLWQDWQG